MMQITGQVNSMIHLLIHRTLQTRKKVARAEYEKAIRTVRAEEYKPCADLVKEWNVRAGIGDDKQRFEPVGLTPFQN